MSRLAPGSDFLNSVPRLVCKFAKDPFVDWRMRWRLRRILSPGAIVVASALIAPTTAASPATATSAVLPGTPVVFCGLWNAAVFEERLEAFLPELCDIWVLVFGGDGDSKEAER